MTRNNADYRQATREYSGIAVALIVLGIEAAVLLL